MFLETAIILMTFSTILHAGSGLTLTDRALCRIKRGFGGFQSGTVGWSCLADIPNSPVCTWDGISCPDGSTVSAISLGGGNILSTTSTSTISSNIGLLTSLESLQLFANNIYGTIPSEIAYLSLLTNLDLQDNPTLSGTIPSSICSLSSLQSLHLNSLPEVGCVQECVMDPILRSVSLPLLTDLTVDELKAVCTGPTVEPSFSPSSPTSPPTGMPSAPSMEPSPQMPTQSPIDSVGSLSTGIGAAGNSQSSTWIIIVVVTILACLCIGICSWYFHYDRKAHSEEEDMRERRLSVLEENKVRRRSSLMGNAKIAADI
jgi:hypothetical protein